MTYLYLLINILSLSVPLLYSFEKRMRFIQHWKSVFLAIFIVAIFFIIWDIIFTYQGVWGFNPQYYLGFTIFKLPIEEILFFICIPYASLFIHYALAYFFKNAVIPLKTTKLITWLLLTIAVVTVIYAFPKKYTTVNFLLFIVLLVYVLITENKLLSRFYISFLIILIPFFITNGILTGSFIENEVVWYNNNENLGIRMFTIPVEDTVYAFNMLFAALILIEKFKPKFKHLKN